jgi:hypothetical protein
MIIGFLGCLQSGKSSACSYVVGEVMKKNGLINSFSMSEAGDLIVPTANNSRGVFDPLDRSDNFVKWAKKFLWPHVKVHNFADKLKRDCVDYFGIPEELAWGNKKDKEKLTKLTWGELAKAQTYKRAELMSPDTRLTIRDVLIVYGDMVRSINENAFVNYSLYEMARSNSNVNVIGDVRFENEVKKIKEIGGKIVRLHKMVVKTNHKSEDALSIDSKLVDVEIHNDTLSLQEKNEIIKTNLIKWGVL